MKNLIIGALAFAAGIYAEKEFNISGRIRETLAGPLSEPMGVPSTSESSEETESAESTMSEEETHSDEE